MSQTPSILFINQHYWPDLAATAQMLTDLAEYLVNEGFDVHVLCSRGHYLSGEMEVPAEEIRHGVKIHRVAATAFGRGTTLGRLTDYASFFSGAIGHVLNGRRYDLLVTLTTPPLLPVVGFLAKKVRGQRYGIWSMDLHPDAEVAAGMFDKSGLPARALHVVNNAGYRGADFVVDLGRYMKQRIRRKDVPNDRLHTIPVWGTREEIEPVPHEENPLREELGLDDKFVVMYSGNAGLAHRFDEMLDVAKRMQDRPDIEFLFVGEGPRKEEILSYIAQHELTNFRYLPYFPRKQLHYSLSVADVHLMSLRREMAGIAVPGKLYGIMAAGRPVVMVGPEASESAETIRKYEAGHVVDPSAGESAADELESVLLDLYVNENRRRRQGQNGREGFLEAFEREVCCRSWAALLRNATDTSPTEKARQGRLKQVEKSNP